MAAIDKLEVLIKVLAIPKPNKIKFMTGTGAFENVTSETSVRLGNLCENLSAVIYLVWNEMAQLCSKLLTCHCITCHYFNSSNNRRLITPIKTMASTIKPIAV